MIQDADSLCLIERLQRPRKVVDGSLPDGTPIKWRLLNASERQQAKAKARERLASLGLNPEALMMADELERECGWQIIALAMRDPRTRGTDRHPYPIPAAWTEDPKTHEKVADAEKLRASLSIHEFALVLDQYLEFEDRENPRAERLTEEQLGGILDALKKKDRAALTDFGADTLSLYLLTTDSQPSSSLTGRYSPGPTSTTMPQ